MSKPSQKNKNALRHGLYASDIVLPWENEADFSALFEEFMTEYKPQGPTEKKLVLDIARLRWLKRRIMRSAQEKFYEAAIASRNGNVAKRGLIESKKNIEEVAKQGEELRQTFKNLSTYINVMRDNLAGAVEQGPKGDMAEKDQVLAAQKLAQEAKSVCRGIDKFVMPQVKLIENASDEKYVVEIAYSADTLERIIRLEGMMDARFEKTLGRLLALQDMRRMISVRKIEQAPNDRKRVE